MYVILGIVIQIDEKESRTEPVSINVQETHDISSSFKTRDIIDNFH